MTGKVKSVVQQLLSRADVPYGCPTRTTSAALLNVLNCVETRENCVDLPLYDATTATLWTFGFFAPPDFWTTTTASCSGFDSASLCAPAGECFTGTPSPSEPITTPNPHQDSDHYHHHRPQPLCLPPSSPNSISCAKSPSSS